MISGAASLLAGVCVVLVIALAGQEFVRMLVAENVSEAMVKVLIAYTTVSFLALGGVKPFAGITGIRFSDSSSDGKFCSVPAVILMILYVLGILVKLVTWSMDGFLGTLIGLAVAGAYFSYVKKVEEYNRTRPSVEDMTLFNLKDGY